MAFSNGNVLPLLEEDSRRMEEKIIYAQSVIRNLSLTGESEHGKLGTNLAPRRCRKPSKVPDIQGTVTSVACGGSHTVALTSDGRAYSFGDGKCDFMSLFSQIL